MFDSLQVCKDFEGKKVEGKKVEVVGWGSGEEAMTIITAAVNSYKKLLSSLEEKEKKTSAMP